MPNEYRVQVIFQVVDLTSPNLAQIEKNIESLAAAAGAAGNKTRGTFRDIAGAFVGLLVAQRIGATIRAIIEPAVQLDKSMGELRATAKFTTAEFDLLRHAALKAAAATSFAPTDAIEGLVKLSKAGLSARGSAAALLPVLALAETSMGRVGVAGAADIAIQVMRGFGISSKDLGRALSEIVAVSKNARLNVEDLSQGIGKLAVGALGAGVGLREAIALLAIAKNVIPSAAAAATELSKAMSLLELPSRQKKLSQLFGVAATAGGRLRPINQILVDIAAAFPKTSSAGAKLAQVFGEIARKPVVAIVGQLVNGIETATGKVLFGAEAMQYFINLARDGGKELQRSLIERSKTAAFQFAILIENTNNLLAVLAGPLVEKLALLAGGFANIVSAIIDWFHKNSFLAGGLKLLVGSVSRFAVVTGGLVAVVLTAFGLSKIWGITMLNLGKFIGVANLETKGLIPSLWLAAKGFYAGATGGFTFAAALRAVGTAAKVTLFGLGKFFIVLGVFEALSFAISGIAKWLGFRVPGLEELSSALASGENLESAIGKATRGFESSGTTVERAAMAMDKVIKHFESLVSTKPPVLDENVIRRIDATAAQMLRQGQLTKQQFAAIHDEASQVTEVLAEVRKAGGRGTEAQFKILSEALARIGGNIRGLDLPALNQFAELMEKSFGAIPFATTQLGVTHRELAIARGEIKEAGAPLGALTPDQLREYISPTGPPRLVEEPTSFAQIFAAEAAQAAWAAERRALTHSTTPTPAEAFSAGISQVFKSGLTIDLNVGEGERLRGMLRLREALEGAL